MSPGQRNLALTGHVVVSVGWLGSVASFLALALAGLTSVDAQLVRTAYIAMELLGWWIIVPLSIASLLSGLLQSLGTAWGLFRHYWVIFKLGINVVASVLLLMHMQPVSQIARVATVHSFSGGTLEGLRLQAAADAGAALLVLLVATALAVYKPRGVTLYGWRNLHEMVP